MSQQWQILSCKAPLQSLEKLALLAESYPYSLVLDSCGYPDAYGTFEFFVAAGHAPIDSIPALSKALNENAWVAGLLPYELKNLFEPLSNLGGVAPVSWPEVACFYPEWIVFQRRGELPVVCGPNPSEVSERWQQQMVPVQGSLPSATFVSNFTAADYCMAVDALKAHIRAGDAYEINLSQQYTAQGVELNPTQVWQALRAAAPVPFSACFRFGQLALVSGSMERFLSLRNGQLVSQPIKGTARRAADPAEDAVTQAALLSSPKDRAENVMIVDMARNDLNRTCIPGTVQVPELFGLYSYRHLHHLISSVTGQLRPDNSPWKAIASAFPPASMTGAPKVAAMRLIEQYERTGRGAYAGALGWFGPDASFDLSVVIRSLQMDAHTGVASYNVGGAVTIDSDPHAEYEETLTKAAAIQRLFPPVSR